MKTSSKVGIGCLVVALLFCVIPAIIFYVSGGLEKAGGVARGVTGIVGSAKEMEKLEKTTPYEPPEDGVVQADRLEAYLAVFREIKPTADQYDEWIAAHEHQRGKGDFKDATEAISLTSKVMSGLARALSEQKMSPKEFRWIGRAMRRAAEESGSPGAIALEREMLASLEEAAQYPGLDGATRGKLLSQISGYRKRLETQEGESASPNRALYLEYADKLKACELGENARLLVGGMGGDHRGHAGVEIR
jgi:hypothetical protein